MKVSVIIPVYNCEEFLEECIGSLLKQTFSDFEIIVVELIFQKLILSNIYLFE